MTTPYAGCCEPLHLGRSHHVNPDRVLHEVSRFEQLAGRWFYVGGDVD